MKELVPLILCLLGFGVITFLVGTFRGEQIGYWKAMKEMKDNE